MCLQSYVVAGLCLVSCATAKGVKSKEGTCAGLEQVRSTKSASLLQQRVGRNEMVEAEETDWMVEETHKQGTQSHFDHQDVLAFAGMKLEEEGADMADSPKDGSTQMSHALNFLTNLAVAEGPNYNLTDTEREALKTINEMVKRVYNNAKTQHNEDQAEVDAARDRVRNATDELLTGLDKNQQLKNMSENSRRNHAVCRKNEKHEGQRTNLACVAYDNYRLAADVSALGCVSADMTAEKIKTDNPRVKKVTEDCLTRAMQVLQPLHEKYEQCKDNTSAVLKAKETCDKKQGEFERAFREYADDLKERCDSYSRHREEAIGELNKTHARVKESEKVRKADHRISQRISCLFRIFVVNNATNKSAMLEECKNLTVSTREFNINYHPIPAAGVCNPEAYGPCDDSWVQREYADQDWSADAPVTNCTPAPAPSTATTTTATTTTTTTAGGTCTSLHTSTLSWTVEHRPPEYSGSWRFENAMDLAPPEYVGPDRQGSSYHYGGDPTFYWVIDIGSSACIKELRIANGHGGGSGSTNPIGSGYASYYHVKDYEVGVSDDPNNFSKMTAGTFPFYDRTRWQTIPVGARGRYIRMNMKSYGKYSTGIAGIEIVG